jgi:hypothetical protein
MGDCVGNFRFYLATCSLALGTATIAYNAPPNWSTALDTQEQVEYWLELADYDFKTAEVM